jgi:NAD(P)-dependent dehydrogenase (short-subunit alcohol dehydrogenase family)
VHVNLRGKHILITGTTSGIGRALAGRFLLEGATVIGFDRDKGKRDPWKRYAVDITNERQVMAAAKKLQEPIDILINNAGIMRRGEVLESSVEDFDTLMAVHLRGAWLMYKAIVPTMPKGGIIVQMSSRHGRSLPKNPALYGLTKHWSIDLGKAVRKAFPHIRLKELYPGPIDTPLMRAGSSTADLKRKTAMMSSPDVLAEHVVSLLTDDRKRLLIFDQRTTRYTLE